MSGKHLGLVLSLGVLAMIGAALAVVLTLALLRSQTASALDEAVAEATEGHRFELLRFEFTHLPNRLLTEVARWFDDDELDDDAALERWFTGREESNRKPAERALERAIARSASAMGLDSPLPLFGDVQLQWPPVDVDLGETLRVLTVSPRSEVRLVRTVLLSSDIEADQFERLEAIVEADGEWAAWVTTIGGVALYPAPVVSSRDYLRTLQVMAHEWTHHYLGFYPLGLSYGRGPEMRTINETVADIVGDELGLQAALTIEAELPVADNPERQALLARTDPILRSLRLEVDELLARGKVDEAEQRMEAARQELAEAGRPFRKINQAFLAFRGGYGASGSSASEWGPRLIALRESSDSLAHFVEQVRGINSPAEADRLLPR